MSNQQVKQQQGNLDQKVELFLVVVLMLLCFKFVFPLLSHAMPLGYDVGINRYLFLQYAEAFPLLPSLESWAREHPPLLFYLFAPWIKLGLPVDWVIGWMWNLFSIVLLAIYATIIGRDRGVKIGIVLLLSGFLSQAYFDGFASMYWKNYLGFLWALLAFSLLEKKSPWSLFFILLCVLTHHVTGLVVGLATISWWVIEGYSQKFSSKWWVVGTISGLILFIAGVIWYLINDFDFVMYQLKFLFKMTDKEVYGGAFPPLFYYLKTMPILLGFGCAGFIMSLKKEMGTVWQFAVLWCLLFIVLKLYFHRRFFLQLDFFLLPFTAHAIYAGITRSKNTAIRAVVYILLIAQCFLAIAGVQNARPIMTRNVLDVIKPISNLVEDDALLLVPENQSAPYVLGWLPDQTIAAPGLYGFTWGEREWEHFMLGNNEQRRQVLQTLPRNSYIVITPSFFRMYPTDVADRLLRSECLLPVEGASLFKVTCTSS